MKVGILADQVVWNVFVSAAAGGLVLRKRVQASVRTLHFGCGRGHEGVVHAGGEEVGVFGDVHGAVRGEVGAGPGGRVEWESVCEVTSIVLSDAVAWRLYKCD